MKRAILIILIAVLLSGCTGQKEVTDQVPESVELQYLGHSGFRLDVKDTVIFIDPYLSNKSEGFERLVPPAYLPENVTRADFVLITHSHMDHLDPSTLSVIKTNTNAMFIGAGDTAGLLRKVVGRDRTMEVQVGDTIPIGDVDVSVMPAEHAGDSVSYLIQMENFSMYHAGDTDYHQVDLEDVDVLAVPIGGTFTMDEVEAAKMVGDIKPETVVPIHYNTFTEIEANVMDFADLIPDDIGLDAMQPGEKIVIEIRAAS